MKPFIPRVLVFFVFLIPGLTATSCSSAYNGAPSDHFDGSTFYGAEADHGFMGMLKWLWEMDTVDWPEWVDDPIQPPPPDRVDAGSLRVTYINHATVLIQMDKLNILTDPVWSYRVGPFSWLGTKRVRDPGVKMDELPKIDYILISHDHYDHLDIPTLKRLEKRDNPVMIIGLGVSSILEANGMTNWLELDWWETYRPDQSKVTFSFVPAQHDSGRGLFSGNATLWGGFVIESPNGRVYFAGDTGFGTFFNQIHRRYSEFRLTILPIGSYEKRWFMKNQHMNPDDAVKTHILLNSAQSMGIHYATFVEHPEQTIDAHEVDLAESIDSRGLETADFWVLKFGEGRDVPYSP